MNLMGTFTFSSTILISKHSTFTEVSDALPESRLIALPNGKLNVSSARREDAGKYKVKATNSEGKTTLKFSLVVLYAPR